VPHQIHYNNLNYGFAAGCAAGLCPADQLKEKWAMPLV
jgi:hypothetical protein